MKPMVKRYKIVSPKLLKPTRIVRMSDFHLTKDYDLKRLDGVIDELDEITQEVPIDFTVINGDFINDSQRIETFYYGTIYKILERTNQNVLYVDGNHEFMTTSPDIDITKEIDWKYYHNQKYYELLKSLSRKLVLLSNRKGEQQFISHDYNICFSGFKQTYNQYEKLTFDNALVSVKWLYNLLFPKPFDDNYYNVLVTHDPRFILRLLEELIANNHDLGLFGHMHNGVTPYWFEPLWDLIIKIVKSIQPNSSLDHTTGILSSDFSSLPQYSRREIQTQDQLNIIGSSILGVATKSPVLKLINTKLVLPPRIDVIDIAKKKL